MLVRMLPAGVAGLFAQQGDHVAGIDAPVVPQHVGDLAFQAENCWQTTRGSGTLGRWMSSIGWQNGQWPRSCSSARPRSASRRPPGRRPRRIARRGPIASDTARPGGTRPGYARTACGWPPDRPATPAQLADSGQPAEVGRVDQLPHPRRQRHVNLGRNPHQRPAGVQGDDFRDVEDGGHP